MEEFHRSGPCFHLILPKKFDWRERYVLEYALSIEKVERLEYHTHLLPYLRHIETRAKDILPEHYDIASIRMFQQIETARNAWPAPPHNRQAGR